MEQETQPAPPADKRIFGTDGVRGRAGQGWLTADRVAALGRAVASVLGSPTTRGGAATRALLGHDGRRSGPELEAALARGLASRGFEAVSAGLITTPGLAWLTRGGDFAVGLMVSASHNPADDNGIKVFAANGEKLADELEDRIEAAWRAEPELRSGDGTRPAVDPTLEARYVEHLVQAAGSLRLAGLTIALDCANGGGSGVAPAVLTRLGATVISLACAPDGSNINRGCGSTHPEALQAAVLDARADLGIALDGDGDRCLLVDERGQLVDGDGLLTLLAAARSADGGVPGGRIVATVMSNKGLYRALGQLGVGVVTVDVGDRRVVEGLRRERLELGGEQSGHIVFGAENHYIGDGVLTALRALAALVRGAVPLSQLASAFAAFPQVLLNVPVRAKPHWSSLPDVAESVRQVEAELGDDGRVLLRYSGTEPLARVMVEGPDETSIREQAERIASRIRASIGA
ncbi:MAG: phosphoglucosamine mutase [Planctomycetaceae bacterium]|nr:phosphoglucosamine mutase [Planctomycetaceae bacterium]